ncbi:DUF1048 domain-containing protein [Ruminococcaceae bacterium OttesenSCG-928-D13]|nr:DUF1048 domain-containing protein [Ruminococcaceae bacterium OttesenSCG-928-D13]
MLDAFIKLVIGDLDEKKEYRKMVKRVKALPEDYRYTYERIQKYIWIFGAGLDMGGLLELFEDSAAEGKPVLEITGDDVAAFCDELIRASGAGSEPLGEKINREIREHFQKEGR